MINKIFLVPTGNEILDGTVIDTNSPLIMEILLESFPACELTRARPVPDDPGKILPALDECLARGADLIILIGGSGSGHRYSPALGKDCTSEALAGYLEAFAAQEIYGANGHLWSKLIAGRKADCLMFNVPGPQVEAVAAARAAIALLRRGDAGLAELAGAARQAVMAQYPAPEDSP